MVTVLRRTIGPYEGIKASVGGSAAAGAGVTEIRTVFWLNCSAPAAVAKLAPTRICGPSGGGLHADDEWLDVDQLHRFTEALSRVLSDWGTAEQD